MKIFIDMDEAETTIPEPQKNVHTARYSYGIVTGRGYIKKRRATAIK